MREDARVRAPHLQPRLDEVSRVVTVPATTPASGAHHHVGHSRAAAKPFAASYAAKKRPLNGAHVAWCIQYAGYRPSTPSCLTIVRTALHEPPSRALEPASS